MGILASQELREAAASFPLKTATNMSGFHVRHVALISDAGLAVLALIYAVLDLTALLPP